VFPQAKIVLTLYTLSQHKNWIWGVDMIKKLKLGDLLLENKVITQFQLEKALSQQKQTGKKLGDVLYRARFDR